MMKLILKTLLRLKSEKIKIYIILCDISALKCLKMT